MKRIEEPSEIYNVLSKGLFRRVAITNGDGSSYNVINAGTWMVYKDKDGKTHTWYYPSYADIAKGWIRSITVIE